MKTIEINPRYNLDDEGRQELVGLRLNLAIKRDACGHRPTVDVDGGGHGWITQNNWSDNFWSDSDLNRTIGAAVNELLQHALDTGDVA